MSEFSVTIKPRSRALKEIKVNTTLKTRVQDILEEYAKVNKLNANRIKFSKLDETGKEKQKQLTLDYKGSIESNGLGNDDIIFAKDLGPQIDWRLVYMLEYIGPLILNTLFYFVYYDASEVTLTQNMVYMLVSLHFLKREYETVFVHQFSLATMPFRNVFKNCGHYWILSGVSFGLTLYRDYVPANASEFSKFFYHVRDTPTDQLILLVIIFGLAEAGNFYSHIILRNLRSDGSKTHKIPHGFLFEYVTCPNYFFESVAMLCLAILTNNWSTWLFFTVATGQMYIWALKKHRNLKKLYGDEYPKSRKVYVPFLL